MRLFERLARKIDNRTFAIRRRLYKPKLSKATARLGIYVAYYDAAWVFEKHLACIRANTSGPFDYYVMANCTTAEERERFDHIAKRHAFVKVFEPWPRSLPYSHANSIQRLIDRTDNEIIVICDIDAFPIKKGWDERIVAELRNKDVAAAVVDMPHRSMPVFLHPCFMAVRRAFLDEHDLDVLPEHDGDPACKITSLLIRKGRLDLDHVTPLYPTRREIQLAPAGQNAFLGQADLIHGFGTTYADLVFHFWFARHIARRAGISDSGTRISEESIRQVIEDVFQRYP